MLTSHLLSPERTNISSITTPYSPIITINDDYQWQGMEQDNTRVVALINLLANTTDIQRAEWAHIGGRAVQAEHLIARSLLPNFWPLVSSTLSGLDDSTQKTKTKTKTRTKTRTRTKTKIKTKTKAKNDPESSFRTMQMWLHFQLMIVAWGEMTWIIISPEFWTNAKCSRLLLRYAPSMISAYDREFCSQSAEASPPMQSSGLWSLNSDLWSLISDL